MAKILVVDDDASVRDALSVALPLQWDTVTVVTAGGGEEGLRAFSEQDPDVVLLDVSLPDVSGLEVLRRIRRVSDVPVLMLTAHGGEIDQVRGLELGADDYITKPFGAMALMARIRAVLRRAGLPAHARSAADVVPRSSSSCSTISPATPGVC
jgi:two-component system response regulator RegX3